MMDAMRWLVVLAGMSCYAPDPPAGGPCSNGMCPEGLVCSPATDTCEHEATPRLDATTADASGVDGADPPADAVADAPADARPDASAPTAAVVQQQTAYAASAAMLSVTLPTPPAAGNLLVMIGGTPSGSLDMVSGGATWTRATFSVTNSNIEVWYGVADGTTATVTIRRTSSTSAMWISASEWSGLATSAVLEGATGDDGVTTTVSAGMLDISNPPALLVFAASAFAPGVWGTPTPAGWTALAPIDGAAVTQRAWFRVTPSAGPGLAVGVARHR